MLRRIEIPHSRFNFFDFTVKVGDRKLEKVAEKDKAPQLPAHEHSHIAAEDVDPPTTSGRDSRERGSRSGEGGGKTERAQGGVVGG